MSKRSGFSLIELIISLGLFSVLLTICLKLNALKQSRSRAIFEEQNLMAYMNVLEWTLRHTKGMKEGFWSGFQDNKTMERKFVRGYAKNKVCSAEIMPEKEGLYRVILRGTTFKNNKINPIELFVAKDAQN